VAPATSGILLHGPSGCGKSSVIAAAYKCCPEVEWFFASGHQLFHKYLGESEARLRGLFSTARRSLPAVVVLEDIDMLASQRVRESSGGLDVNRRMLAALLCELDGAESRNVLVIATTSATLDSLDSAVLRQGRLETLLGIGGMSSEGVAAMVDCFLSLHGEVEDRERILQACLALVGCSAATVELVLRTMVQRMIRDSAKVVSLPLVLCAMRECHAFIRAVR
jgi:ATP-dependent 26S proteasome regulatory subunit